MPTAKEKKEGVKIHLKKLRAELREMHLKVTEELILPEPSQVKEVMKSMEELLLVIDPKLAKKKSKQKK